MKAPLHLVSDHYDVRLCRSCPHLHFLFFDVDENVICEAVLTADQLRRAADFADGLPGQLTN